MAVVIVYKKEVENELGISLTDLDLLLIVKSVCMLISLSSCYDVFDDKYYDYAERLFGSRVFFKISTMALSGDEFTLKQNNSGVILQWLK